MKRITQKIITVFEAILLLFLFNNVFWVCNVFPRHILEFDSFYSLFAILLNLLFHGLLACILVYHKEKSISNKTDFNLKIMFQSRLHIKRIFVLLLLQLLIDLLNFLCIKGVPGYFYILSNLLTFSFWIITFMILYGTRAKVNQRKVIFLVLATFGLGLCLFFDFKAMAEQQSLLQKITADQVGWTQFFDNLNFEHSNRNFYLDTYLGSLFLIDTALQRTYSEQISFSSVISRFVARIFLLMTAFLLTILIKLLIFPNATLIKRAHSYSESKTYLQENQFFINDDEQTVYRLNESRERVCCYRKNKYIISYGNKDSVKKIEEFYLCESESDSEDRPLKNQGFCFDIGDVSVEIYGNWAICYAIEDQPTVIYFDEIINQPRNEVLIEVCKRMIEEGNILAFEYAGEYLLIHAPEFIHVYAERFANADFTYFEAQYIADYEYRTDYLISVATKLNNNVK